MQYCTSRYELKLTYPGHGDIHWKQSVNPASGDSLLTGHFEFVENLAPVWHKVFQQTNCEVTYDVGADYFNALFGRSTWPLVRYDRRDENPMSGEGELVPYGYYRRLSRIPPGFSLYDTILNSFASHSVGNEQDIDWRAFSSEMEAIDDTNPWADCEYDGRTGRGFPGDCGPAGDTKMRWLSKEACSTMASPDVAVYIYAPGNAVAMKPQMFRGLSSALAGQHGHLLDGEGLDTITEHDDEGYVPWYGVGVSQTAPAANWQAGTEDVQAENAGFTFHWWYHDGSVPALREKDTYPDSPDGVVELTDLAETPTNVRDRYAGRMFGWYRADQDGDHYFYIASDDNGELYLGEDEDSATMIASVPSWTPPRVWDRFEQQRSSAQHLKKGKFYWVEAFFQEGGGGDNLAIGVVKPDQRESMPIEVTGHLFKQKIVQSQPRAMKMTPCAMEGEECTFHNMAVVRYSLGWDSVPPIYTVEENGVTCQAFGSGVGGDEYVEVATERICAGQTADKVEEIAPGDLPGDVTAKEVVAACRRKCSARADCTHFVSW